MERKPHILDHYVLDTLMADLVGHDRRPSAFLVYLAILAEAAHGRAILSYAELAERTGLSKRTIQNAAAALARRRLVEIRKSGPTEAMEYLPLSPWRRPGACS
jgi:DNA-binding transcriptional ArsR family regulator